MVRGVASMLEKHHRVQVLDEALEAAVRLSHRYIPARQLPDKAVSLLDTACARVAISQHARAAAARRLPPDDRGAADRAGDHRPRGSGRHRRRRAPAGVRGEARGERSSAAPSSRSGGRPSASWSIASWRSARSCGRAASRSKAPAASSSRRREVAEGAPATRAAATRGRDAGGARRSCSRELDAISSRSSRRCRASRR